PNRPIINPSNNIPFLTPPPPHPTQPNMIPPVRHHNPKANNKDPAAPITARFFLLIPPHFDPSG
ncbi:hypothetical protein A2U01_0117743, partial [Trifolium medium]|nr:hypothetical protein [Trifolium medium]